MADNLKSGLELAETGTKIVSTRQQTGGEHVQRITFARRDFGTTSGNSTDLKKSYPLPIHTAVDGPVNKGFAKYLENGGSRAVTSFYGSDTFFTASPGSSVAWKIYSLTCCIADNTGEMDPTKYGGVGAPSQGIRLAVVNSSNVVQQEWIVANTPGTGGLDPQGRKINKILLWVAHDPMYFFYRQGSGATDPFLWRFHINFVEQYGMPLLVSGTDKFAAIARGSFSGLTIHQFMIQGYVADSEY